MQLRCPQNPVLPKHIAPAVDSVPGGTFARWFGLRLVSGKFIWLWLSNNLHLQNWNQKQRHHLTTDQNNKEYWSYRQFQTSFWLPFRTWYNMLTMTTTTIFGRGTYDRNTIFRIGQLYRSWYCYHWLCRRMRQPCVYIIDVGVRMLDAVSVCRLTLLLCWHCFWIPLIRITVLWASNEDAIDLCRTWSCSTWI